jgi:hypothetical protein
MAANVETYAPEKDASLQSSDAARPGHGGGGGAARDLDQNRRSALARVDDAPFSSVPFSSFAMYMLNFFFRSWFHVKICAVAGVGFFTDA